MFPRYTIKEGWESPFPLVLDLGFCSHEECKLFLSIFSHSPSACDPEILHISNEVLKRINDINYDIKHVDSGDPLIKLVRYTFNFLRLKKEDKKFYEKCKEICDTFNYYLNNDPPDISPHPVSPISPPPVETKGKVHNLKDTVKEVSIPKIMKKAKKN